MDHTTKRSFNSPINLPKKKKERDPHDNMHMPAWSNSGHCYCFCKVCWEWNTLKGMCRCPDCACGKFELTMGPANG